MWPALSRRIFASPQTSSKHALDSSSSDLHSFAEKLSVWEFLTVVAVCTFYTQRKTCFTVLLQIIHAFLSLPLITFVLLPACLLIFLILQIRLQILTSLHAKWHSQRGTSRYSLSFWHTQTDRDNAYSRVWQRISPDREQGYCWLQMRKFFLSDVHTGKPESPFSKNFVNPLHRKAGDLQVFLNHSLQLRGLL